MGLLNAHTIWKLGLYFNMLVVSKRCARLAMHDIHQLPMHCKACVKHRAKI